MMVIEEGIPATPRTYPWIGISPNGHVVLLHSPECGITLIKSSSCTSKVGDYSKNLATEKFKHYTGTISLSN